MPPHAPTFLPSALRRFIESETAAGLVLMGSAALALVVANSPAAPLYRAALAAHLLGLSTLHWVNDAAMAVFFCLVGLEIKRELLHGQLRRWSARALPGIAAAGGMIGPALVYAAVNAGLPSLRGWAIPSATDIAFVLGVIALLKNRVPASLKVFLTALAVIDDLGAVIIIAIVYADDVSGGMLGLAALTLASLAALNVAGVRTLWPYLALGVALWLFVFLSGVHATVAGVLLALTIPADDRPDGASPLARLEIAIAGGVAFVVLPLFGFANAGVALGAVGADSLLRPVTLGVAAGLVLGKQAGVMASAGLAMALGIAKRPSGVTLRQFYGAAVLCGIGFTMSFFIGMLAFAHSPESQDDTKVGVFVGSLLSAGLGSLVLWLAPPARRRRSRLRE